MALAETHLRRARGLDVTCASTLHLLIATACVCAGLWGIVIAALSA